MPAIVKRLNEGELVDVPYRATSLNDAARYEPRDGVYTVANTSNRTQTLLLDAHFDRLEDSAARAGIVLRLDRRRVKSALRQMILDSDFGDVRLRISVPANTPDEMILSIEPFQTPAAALVQNGATCITSAAASRQNPAAKSSEWMHERLTLASVMPAGIYETFLLDREGIHILEGMSSNFYAVKNDELYTAGSGILAGISRRIVFEVCKGIIPLRLEAPHVNDVNNFGEAFLTSSSRGIIPVVAIDGIVIGAGQVGAKTIALRDAYEHWVSRHLEEL